MCQWLGSLCMRTSVAFVEMIPRSAGMFSKESSQTKWQLEYSCADGTSGYNVREGELIGARYTTKVNFEFYMLLFKLIIKTGHYHRHTKIEYSTMNPYSNRIIRTCYRLCWLCLIFLLKFKFNMRQIILFMCKKFNSFFSQLSRMFYFIDRYKIYWSIEQDEPRTSIFMNK